MRLEAKMNETFNERYTINNLKNTENLDYMYCSGGSRVSQRWTSTQKGDSTYYLAKICQKLHENEENWTERRARIQNFTM